MRTFFLSCLAVAGLMMTSCGNPYNKVLIDDDFSGYPLGLFTPDVGPELEYHFIEAKFPEGNWRQAAFNDRQLDTCYSFVTVNGAPAMFQGYVPSPRKTGNSHPIIISGTEFWSDYTMTCTLTPMDIREQSGVVFRYQNSRQYYYFGFENKKGFENKVIAYRVNHATGPGKPIEDVMAEGDFTCEAGKTYVLSVTATGDHFEMSVDGVKVLEFTDDFYKKGKVGFFSDMPCYFHKVTVMTSGKELRRIAAEQKAKDDEEAALQAANPKPVLWKKFSTKGFGTSRNVRFGDIDGDGKLDVLFAQVLQRSYPRVDLCEITCLTAVTMDGDIIWQIGTPSDDPHATHISNDTAFQIVDIDGDGKNEVVYAMNQELIIADAASGKTLKKVPTPATDATTIKDKGLKNILGDCIMICNVSGKATPQDIMIKNRYEKVWVYDNNLKLLWAANANTGHYPYPCDVDGDGKDEIAVGYTLFSHDGKRLWSWEDGRVNDHCDGVAIVNPNPSDPNSRLKFYNAASGEGVIIADALTGEIEKQYFIGHAQNPVILNLRDDKPGLELASINFWGNQGIIHYFDSEGNLYYSFEPINSGSMMLPTNWTGKTEEFIMHNPHIKYGGMYDGWGRKVVVFPDDGHPVLCNAVLDITGDVRDEIVVWDQFSMWIYTQDNGPLDDATLYHPKRNPLYNYSNYQMSVSQ